MPERLIGGGDGSCRSGDRDCLCVEYEDKDGDDEEFCCIVSMDKSLTW